MIFDVLESEGGNSFHIRKILYTEKRFLKIRGRVETEKVATLFLPLNKVAATLEECVEIFFAKEDVPGNRVRAKQNFLQTPLPPFVFIELGFRKKCEYESISMAILKAMDISTDDLTQSR